jgi:hypothetical protein
MDNVLRCVEQFLPPAEAASVAGYPFSANFGSARYLLGANLRSSYWPSPFATWRPAGMLPYNEPENAISNANNTPFDR